MGEEMSNQGPLTRAYHFVRGVTFIMIGYAISITVLMTLRGTVLAGTADGTWHMFFGGWVLATFALLGFLFGS